MAIFGGAALGFIMSLTEDYVERRKEMVSYKKKIKSLA